MSSSTAETHRAAIHWHASQRKPEIVHQYRSNDADTMSLLLCLLIKNREKFHQKNKKLNRQLKESMERDVPLLTRVISPIRVHERAMPNMLSTLAVEYQ